MLVTQVAFGRPGQEPYDLSGPLEIRTVLRENRYRTSDLVRGAFGRLPFTVLNFTRAAMKAELARLGDKRRFDIAQIEGVQFAGYLPLLRRCAGAVVCDWHNIESEILLRYSESERHPARKAYARLMALRLRHFERRFLDECDMHVAVSERDRGALEERTARPVHVIHNGVDVAYFSESEMRRSCVGVPDGARRRLLFVGAMDYHANADAALSFARESWPEIRAQVPEAVFTIVGREPLPAVRRLAILPGIEVTGTVADVRPYYAESFACVVPLRVAGGTRLKILESMAAGVPVISTSRGAEGLSARPGIEFLLADGAAEMCQCAVQLHRNPEKAATLAGAGRRLVAERYDWPVLARKWMELLTGLAGRRASSARGA
jgi:glycosyltransferase involved in cell wall biosynthesis